MQLLTKLLSKKTTMKKDFKQFFLEDVGQSMTKECDYETVDMESQNQQSEQKDDFYVEGEEQNTDSNGIKSKQFWNGMTVPNGASQPSTQEINFSFRCTNSFGFNSLGRDNLILIQGQICKAAGCVLIFCENVYTYHNNRISTLSYNKQCGQLLSGSQGKRPQLILWKYNRQLKALQFKKKIFIGAKAEPIYAVQFFHDQYIIAIQKFSLHKCSTMHVFHKQTCKRESLKIGKFYDIQILQSIEKKENKRIFLANDEGIHQFLNEPNQINQYKFGTKLILQDSNITCLFPFYRQNSQIKKQLSKNFQIISGNKKGQISLVFTSISKKVHNGWVFQIKASLCNNQLIFFTAGAIDCKITLSKLQEQTINTIMSFNFQGYVRSLFIENQHLIIGNRDGKIQLYNIPQIIKQKQVQKGRMLSIPSFKSFSAKFPNKQYFLYDKKLSRYLYGNSRLKKIFFYDSNKKQILQLESYYLRQCPQTLSLFQSNIAYTYNIFDKESSQKTQKTKTIQSSPSKTLSHDLQQRERKFIKSVLVIQNYCSKKLLRKISLKLSGEIYGQCSCLQYSPYGHFLAIGFKDGSIGLLDLQVQENQNLILLQNKHQQQILQLIWNREENKLKSCSLSEVFYWDVRKDPNQPLLIIKNIKSRQAKQVQWTYIGRFNWENKAIWQRIQMVEDVHKIWSHQIISTQKVSKNQTQSLKNRIIGCNFGDGKLRLYKSPPNVNKYRELKVFDSKFQICPYFQNSQNLMFWIVFEGVALLIKLE